MTIFSLEHAEPRIEGYLCRHLTKIRPGVFVGRISASRRTSLWDRIIKEQPDIDAVLCYPAELGKIRFETNGEPTRKISKIDEVQFISRTPRRVELWRRALAKPAYININGIYCHGKPLWEHLFETGLFAKILLTESAYHRAVDTLHGMANNISGEQLVDSICYLVAIHDIGKISPYFQAKMGADDCVLFGATQIPDTQFRHEKYSQYLLKTRLLPRYGLNRRTKNVLADIIGDHHQCKPDNSGDHFPADTNEALLEQAIDGLENHIFDIFPFTPFSILPGRENAFCQIVSGIVRLSDWSVSSFAHELTSDGKSDEEYARCVINRCKKYISDGGLSTWEPESHYNYADLFDAFSSSAVTLRPLQEKMIDVIDKHPLAECIVIESEPGSGKTEAGLYAAMNLMKSKNLQGLYFALPTGATAEAMLPRLQALKEKTGAWDDTDLRLLTSLAWMRYSSDDADAKRDWTKSGPRKLFSKLACGTVDQLMAAGEKLKAGDMRLLALSNKAIIIDEFHAYDAYMLDILLVILRWAKELYIPVIILSATLRQESLRKICGIYSKNVPNTLSSAYPLITVADNDRISQYECASTFHKTYPISTVHQDELVGEILSSVSAGGNTVYIANTVRRALDMYNKLMALKPADVELHIYTASTTPENKEKMGSDIVYRYGKQGKADEKRPQKSILIATQIMEMSMDVDFDTMFSDLAPADSILQRIGRMRRHDDAGTIRETGFKSIFYLVLPDRSRSGWALPYSEAVLTATENALSKMSQISVPEDTRPLIEQTYGEAGDDWMQEERHKSAAAQSHIIGNPEDAYRPEQQLRTMAETRLSDRQSVNVLCLDDEDIERLPVAKSWSTEKCRKWCEEIISKHSVKTYADKLGKLEIAPMDSEDLPVWLQDYEIARNHEEYWHGDETFFV